MLSGWIRIDPPEPKVFIVGVDLGQSADPSAVVVIEREGDGATATYDVGHVERLPLATRYPAVVAHVRDVIRALTSQRPEPMVCLVVDRTGVGRPVGDLMTEDSVGVSPVLVTIHGGDATSRADDGGWRVAKRELVSVVQAVLQTSRFRFAEDEPLLNALKEELAGFRAKIKLASGHVSFEAGEDWRSAPHDDLVLALSLAVWAGEGGIGTHRWETLTGEPLDEWFRRAGVNVM